VGVKNIWTITVEMDIHRDLRLDSILTKPYTIEDIERIENYAEEIANEKMNRQLYTSGIPYTAERIKSTVLAMSADPIAYSLAALDKQQGKVSDKQLKSKTFFTQHYLDPAKSLVIQVLNGKAVSNELICNIANIKQSDLEKSKEILSPPKRGMAAAMAVRDLRQKLHPSWIPKVGKRPDSSKTQEIAKPTKVDSAATGFVPKKTIGIFTFPILPSLPIKLKLILLPLKLF
jgi:cobaltochelatase CobN